MLLIDTLQSFYVEDLKSFFELMLVLTILIDPLQSFVPSLPSSPFTRTKSSCLADQQKSFGQTDYFRKINYFFPIFFQSCCLIDQQKSFGQTDCFSTRKTSSSNMFIQFMNLLIELGHHSHLGKQISSKKEKTT